MFCIAWYDFDPRSRNFTQGHPHLLPKAIWVKYGPDRAKGKNIWLEEIFIPFFYALILQPRKLIQGHCTLFTQRH